MADSTSPELFRTLGTIGKYTGPINSCESGRNVRQAFGLYAVDMLKVLDGTPSPEETDVDGVNAWMKVNNNIYSILYFHTEGSATITVRAHESTEVGRLGDGVAAWKALKERFDGNTKDARRACWEKLFTTTMPSGGCLLYTSPSPRDLSTSRMPSSA